MSTISDRLRQFVDDEMTFPGNPDVVCTELITALAEQIVRVAAIDDKARDLLLGRKPKP
jgi:hypothetical protein